jgi:catechol 2,3-dioxygenase-like lactoylglutathione lyase family enzyme
MIGDETMIRIDNIDHFVLTVRSLETSIRFYADVLGGERVERPGKPSAVRLGQQKINLHEVGHSFEPKADAPTPGSGDFCLITRQPIEDILAHLATCNVSVEIGPVERHGALGPMTSVYFRDPDRNLVEVSRYHVG